MKQVEKVVGLDARRGQHDRHDRFAAGKSFFATLRLKRYADRNRLGEIDVRLAKIAIQHLSRPAPALTELPFEAAKRVIEDKARYAWFSDRPVR